MDNLPHDHWIPACAGMTEVLLPTAYTLESSFNTCLPSLPHPFLPIPSPPSALQ